MIWSTGMLTIFLRSRSFSRKEGPRNIAGRQKAVLELADAMQEQLLYLEIDDMAGSTPNPARDSDDNIKHKTALLSPSSANKQSAFTSSSHSTLYSPSSLSEATLTRRINKDLRGGSISYRRHARPLRISPDDKQDLDTATTPTTNKLRRWLYREKWGLLALLATAGITAGATASFWMKGGQMDVWIVSIGLSFAVPFGFFTGSTGASRVTLFMYAFVLASVIPAIIVACMTVAD